MMSTILYMLILNLLTKNKYTYMLSISTIYLFFISINNLNFFTNISYSMGSDIISMPMIMLTLVITMFMSISMKMNLMKIMMINTTCIILILVFSSMNMMLMYMYFEASLIPITLIIFWWGYQPERILASVYLMFYTLFASMPLLIAITYIYTNYKTLFFDMSFGISYSIIMHMSLLISFMFKMPLFLFHFWLPKAHVQAPLIGSMILAAVILKIGGYGLIRFVFIYEMSFMKFSNTWFSISILGAILVSMISMIQGDVKCLIAYSSVCHMSMCMVGITSMNKTGILGSLIMMISHGLCSSALFFLANLSYERVKSRSFFINKGMMMFLPSISMFWFSMCMINMGCPPSINFISEFLLISSAMIFCKKSLTLIFFMCILSSYFSLYLYSFTQHGMFNENFSNSNSLVREKLILTAHLILLIMPILCMTFFY